MGRFVGSTPINLETGRAPWWVFVLLTFASGGLFLIILVWVLIMDTFKGRK